MRSGDERGSRKRALVLYGLYSLVAVTALLYYKFPSDSIRDYIESAVQSRISPMVLRVGSVDLDLPPGLVFKDLRLSLRDRPEKIFFSAGDLRVRPEAGQLIRGIPAAAIQCSVQGGSFSGSVRLTERRLQGTVAADVELNGIRLEDNAALQEVLGRGIEGVVEGTMTFRGTAADPLGGAGEIRFVARDGSVEIMQPFLGLDFLEFTKVVLNGDLRDRRFLLTSGDIEGPDYRGSLTGTVIPADGLVDSRLNLQGWVEPFPTFFARRGASSAFNFVRQRLRQGKLNFSIRGTLEKPVFNLS